MAKNRVPETPKPEESSDSDPVPEVSPDSDSLVSESGSEAESESDPGSESESESENQPPNPKSSNPPPATPNSDDSESEPEPEPHSDSDSDESEPEPEPTPEKPKPNPTPPVQISPVKGSAVGVKRGGGKAAETPNTKKAKKIEPLVKKDSGEGKLEESSKKLFQRVFSEDDEIGLLKVMVEFSAKKESDPVAKFDDFLQFVKKSLPLDVTKAQLLNKMKRLRGKYKGHASKVKDGEVKISKPHERESYELSKMIWGVLDGESNSGDGGVEGKKVNGSVVKKCVNKNALATGKPRDEDAVTVAVLVANGVDDKVKSASAGGIGVTDGVGGISMNLTLEERIMREEIKNVDAETQKELGKKLREIEEWELELCARRCEYVAQKARLMIAAKKNEL